MALEVLGGTLVLPGDCRVAIAHKMNVLESLGKVVFGPLTPRGGFGGDPPPHSRAQGFWRPGGGR